MIWSHAGTYKILFISFLLYCSGYCTLQAQLPNRTAEAWVPSFSENFEDFGSFPSLCIQDFHQTESGRVFLQTCGSVFSVQGVHLFRFDGYTFTAVGGVLDSLGHFDEILQLSDSEKLLVYRYDPAHRIPTLISIDLRNQVFEKTELQLSGETLDMQMGANGEVLITEMQDSDLVLHTWKHKELITRGRFLPSLSSDGIARIEPLDQSQTEIWYYDVEQPFVVRYDTRSGIQRRYELPEVNIATGERISIRAFRYSGQFYLLSRKGSKTKLLVYNEQEDRFSEVDFLPMDVQVSGIFRDEKGNVLYLYRNAQNVFGALVRDLDGLLHDCSSFFKDERYIHVESVTGSDFSREIIICYNSGITIHSVRESRAIRHLVENESIRGICEIGNNALMVNTGNHVYSVNIETGASTLMDPGGLRTGPRKIFRDKDGMIWSSDQDGLIRNDLQKKKWELVISDESVRLFAFMNDSLVALVNGDNSLLVANIRTSKVDPVVIDGKPVVFDGFANDLLCSRDGLIWIATSRGLCKINLNESVQEQLGFNYPFSDYRFVSLFEDRSGRIWAGTSFNGVYRIDPESGEASNISSDHGLSNNTVVSITQDLNGVLWLGTYKGISLVSASGDFLMNLGEEDGLVNNECNRYGAYCTLGGEVLIGTIRGLNLINSSQVLRSLRSDNTPGIYLTDIEYDDRDQDKNHQLHLASIAEHAVILPATNRFLEVHFALSNYTKSLSNKYFYNLDGSDDWISIGNQHWIVLSNLPSGKYDLRIKGIDPYGNQTQDPLVISIEAKAFFYERISFYILCLAIGAVAVLLWILRLRTLVKKATAKIEEDKKLIEQQAESLLSLDKLKNEFFANISHEFRTPLTVISGMADQIRNEPEKWSDKGVGLIQQNANRLLNLVNQLLDLQKLESGHYVLEMVQGDLIGYIQHICESFTPYAKSKGIDLHFMNEGQSFYMDYDPDKILRILSNLLSNAIKHTPEGGDIYVQTVPATNNESRFQLKVRDTGKGIPSDELTHIFDRFYQTASGDNSKNVGTGIGLALVRQLVKIMGGVIEVQSEEGKGSEFTIAIPISQNAEQKENNPPVPTQNLYAKPIEDATSSSINSENEELPVLLLVEDNADLRSYITSILESRFRVLEAHNGQQGLELALEEVPDIIVSDVMMPLKNGYELCESVKSDEKTSHIPVILLTSRADQSSRITGLEKGADNYLIKPFETKELLLYIDNHLSFKKKLQERLSAFVDLKDSQELKNSPEEQFLMKFMKLIDSQISNTSFGMPEISRELAMSRSQVFRKIKALTGMSPTAYIRKYRLHKAKELLLTADMNVSEAADAVGFSSISHFSSAFSEEFGHNPSSVIK